MTTIKTLIDKFSSKKLFPYISLLIVHVILILITFTPHILNPSDTIFTNWGDGLKNYYTLLSYVNEPITDEGIFKYGMMSYPFGDYVYATDNTPLFSIPFRWFCHHVYDLSDYTIPLFNFFVIGNIILCGLLVFFIFNKIIKNRGLSWILAVVLPWTNFQLMRIVQGHYNLSLTVLCLIPFVFLLLWEKHRHSRKQSLLHVMSMVFFSYCCFLIHGYYLAIIPVFLCAMLGFSGVIKIIRKKDGGWPSLSAALIVISSSALIAIGSLIITDDFFFLRKINVHGYDWMEQKTNFSLLFTHYEYHHLFFPVWSTKNPNSIELMCYLGNIGLYATGILFVISIFNRKMRALLWETQKKFFSDPLKAGIVLAGLLLLSMSIGENYYPLMEPFKVTLPFRTDGPIPLGTLLFMALSGCLVMVSLVKVFSGRKKLIELPSDRLTVKTKLTRAVLFYVGSALMLFVMFGRYSIDHWVNMTNPLWIAHQFTDTVEQFRSMVRFAWPFYWSFYIWIMFTVSALYLQLTQSGKVLIVSLMILLGGTETIDYIITLKERANISNVFSKNGLDPFHHLQLNPDAYQAILPIPYYNAGSEDYNNTIDDIEEWSRYTFQLSVFSKLPLMSAKMARTPPEFAETLLEMIIGDTIPYAIVQQLNDKPILIVENRSFLNDSTLNVIPAPVEKPHAHTAFWKSNDFVKRHSLQIIDSVGSIYYYKWDWKENASHKAGATHAH